MNSNYGYDDSYDEYSFPPRRSTFDGYDDEYDMYLTDDDFLDETDACSTTDCTGLVQNGTGYIEALDSYRQVYSFGQPENTGKRRGLKM